MLRPTSGKVRSAAVDIAGGPGWMEGRVVWDLCCGSGAFGLECLSEGASSCLFVDSSRQCTSFVSRTLEALGAGGRGTVLCSDLTGLDLGDLPAPDMVFIDPPYDGTRLYSWASQQRWGDVLRPGGIVLVESRTGSPVPGGYASRRYGDTMLCWRWFG